jgi:hypothetical protein
MRKGRVLAVGGAVFVAVGIQNGHRARPLLGIGLRRADPCKNRVHIGFTHRLKPPIPHPTPPTQPQKTPPPIQKKSRKATTDTLPPTALTLAIFPVIVYTAYKVRRINHTTLPLPVRSLILASMLFLLARGVWGTDYTWTGSGDPSVWNDPLNWDDGVSNPNSLVPDSGDTAIIPSGTTLAIDINTQADLTNGGTLSGAVTVGGNITNNGTISGVITVTGSFTNTGTISVSAFAELPSGVTSYAGTVILTGDDTLGTTLSFSELVVDTNVTLTLTALPTVTALTNNGIISTSDPDFLPTTISGAGDIDLTITSSVTATAALSIRNLTIENSGDLQMDGNALSVSGTYSNKGTLTLTGTETLSLTQDTDSGTTKYTGGTGLCGLLSFYNLELSNGSPVLSGNITVDGETKVTLGSLTLNSYTLTTKTFTGTNGTITSNGGTIAITDTVIGGFSNGNTVLAGSGITLSVEAGDISVTGSPTVASVKLTNNGSGTVTFETDAVTSLTVAGVTASGDVSLTASNGSVTAAAVSSTSGAITISGTALTLNNTVSAKGNVSLTSTNGDVTASAAVSSTDGAVTISGKTLVLNNTVSAANSTNGKVTLDATNSAVSVSSVITAGNALSVSAKGGITLEASNAAASVSLTNANSGAVSFKNGGDLDIVSVSNTGRDVTINSGGAITQTGGITGGTTTLMATAITLSQTNTLGALNVVNSDVFTLSADLSLSTGGFSQTGDGTNTIGADIQTVAAGATIGFKTAVTLSADAEFTANGSDITFGSTVDGTADKAQSLTINTRSDAKNVIFSGKVGLIKALKTLSIKKGIVKNNASGPALSIKAEKLELASDTALNTSGSANKDITLETDTLMLADTGNGAKINAGAGTISIAPIATGKTIEFGDENDLAITSDIYYSSLWASIVAQKFTIGNASTSTIYISKTGANVIFSGNGVPYEVEFVAGANIEIRGDYKSNSKKLTLTPTGSTIIFDSTADITVDLGTAPFEVLNNVELNSGGKSVSIKATGGISFGKVDTATPANAKVVDIAANSASNGLTLNAGGSVILFNGKIGTSTNKIGALTINDESTGSGAVDIIFNDAVYTGGALTINNGSTGNFAANITFNNTVNVTGALTISDTRTAAGSGTANITFNNTVSVTGAVDIMHTGTLTTAPGDSNASPSPIPTATITAGGGFKQSGTPAANAKNSIGGNITTTNTPIELNRTVDITNATGIILTSGTGAVSFPAVTGAGKTFTVTATGAVTVSGDIGGDGTGTHPARLGAVSLTGTGITLNKSGGSAIYTNYQNITLEAGTGDLAVSASADLTLDVASPPVTTPSTPASAITLIAASSSAGTITLTGTATLDSHKSGGGNQAIDANITLTKTSRITLAPTNSATGIIQATGKKLTLEDDGSSGATLDLVASDWLVGTTDSASERGFYVFENNTFSAGAKSSLVMSGTGKTIMIKDKQKLGNLTISTVGNNAVTDMVKLGEPLVLQGDMTLKNGDGTNGYALFVSDGNYNIEVGGNWTQTSQSDFNPVGNTPPDSSTLTVGDTDSATVIFTGTSPGARTVIIEGKTNWYNLALTYANGIKEVQFSNFPATETTVTDNGHRVRHKLYLVGSSSTPLVVTAITETVPTGDQPDPASDSPDNHWWVFENAQTVLDSRCEYYKVSYSWATSRVGTIDLNKGHTVYPYSTLFNVNWIPPNVFFYSFTEDSDGNGRIDRIRAQASGLLKGDFSSFEVKVDGYEVDKDRYEFCGADHEMIYIWLKDEERSAPDTGRHPQWGVTKNDSLFINDNIPIRGEFSPSDIIDTAPPRISYTLAVPGDENVYVRMSEPVLLDTNTITKIKNSAFASSTIKIKEVNSIPSSAIYTSEFYLTLDGPVSTTDLVNGTMAVFDDLYDKNERPTKIPKPFDENVNVPPQFPKAYPPQFSPSFVFEYIKLDNTGTADLDLDFSGLKSKGLLIDIPNRFKVNSDSASEEHRVSDMLIMVEPDPALKTDPHLSIWPLSMRDAIPTEMDMNNNVIGRVDQYDGRGRLRPPQIETDFILKTEGPQNKVIPAIETAKNGMGFYFSSVDGFKDVSNLTLVIERLKQTGGAWLPTQAEVKDLNNADANKDKPPMPDSPSNWKDLLWGFGPLKKDYTDTHLQMSPVKDLFSYSDLSVPMREIVYVLKDSSGQALYGLRLDTRNENNQYHFPNDWWTWDPARGHLYLKPFYFITLGLNSQMGNVTILNNVINSAKQEHTVVNYTLSRKGRVTINVFTLDGTLIRQLVRGTREAGNHDAEWDGLNQGGRAVARGMYFIRVVAPDIDEIRKVMVIK